jgi:hypothetical protein
MIKDLVALPTSKCQIGAVRRYRGGEAVDPEVEVVSRPRYYANAQRISACVSGYMAMCKTLAPGPNGVGKARDGRSGFLLSTDSAHDIASTAIRQRPMRMSLVLTPNLHHIATIRRSPALAQAYRHTARIFCDGWPVQLYARLCGQARLASNGL